MQDQHFRFDAFLDRTIRPVNFAELLQAAVVGCLVIAFLGGKFSFTRFESESSANEWFEIRLWFTAFALIGMTLRNRLYPARAALAAHAQIFWVVGSVVFLHAVFLGSIGWRLDIVIARVQIVDLSYVIIHALLFAYLVRTRDDLLTFIYFVELISLMLFGFSLAGYGHKDLYGDGWAPFGTPVSFYRTEYLCFCCGLFAGASTSSRADRVAQFTIAAIGMLCTALSTSKAALLAAIIVAAYLCIALCVVSRPRFAALVIGLLIFGVAMTAANDRLSTVIGLKWSSVNIETTEPASQPRPTTPEAGVSSTVPSLPGVGTPPAVAPAPSPNAAPVVEDRAKVTGGTPRSDAVTVQDRSQRIRMAIHAWKLFEDHPIWGIGFGHYRATVPVSYRASPDIFSYPHNIVMEVLAATGLVGTGLFAITAMIALIVMHQAVRMDINWLFLLAYPGFVLFSALFSGDIYDFRGFWFLAIVIAGTAWPPKGVMESIAL